MDYFDDVFIAFMDMNRYIHFQWRKQKARRLNLKYLKLCSEDEQRSYGLGRTWGWVINDIIFIFWWNNPL